MVSGRGGYLSVSELLQQHDLTHHWKEYSRAELRALLGAVGFEERRVETLTGAGDATPRWVSRVCRPWGQFLYAEYSK